MNPLFQTLADLHRKSPVRQRDFTTDYEKFLRLANVADGDERELAEKELRRAAAGSDGAFGIDRAKKSGYPERLRIALDGGESWLFSTCGGATPTAEREETAVFFETASQISVAERWQASWSEWCLSLAEKARAGSSIQPFTAPIRSDLMEAITGVLNWQGESLIRYASAQICGDSKRLQALGGRISAALVEITGETFPEAFGILNKPRSVMLHGPLVLRIGKNIWDFSQLPGAVTLSETNLIPATLSTTATICLTVENEDVFMELLKMNSGMLLIQTSFPGAAVRRLIRGLPEMTFLHFGDSDPAGFDILRDLREKTGRNFLPILMDHRPAKEPVPFSQQEIETLRRLISNPLMKGLLTTLESILNSGDKGNFEQESIPSEEILEYLESMIIAG
jgi:hypothetical protein